MSITIVNKENFKNIIFYNVDDKYFESKSLKLDFKTTIQNNKISSILLYIVRNDEAFFINSNNIVARHLKIFISDNLDDNVTLTRKIKFRLDIKPDRNISTITFDLYLKLTEKGETPSSDGMSWRDEIHCTIN